MKRKWIGKLSLAYLAAMLAITACKVSNDLQTPKMSLPAKFRGQVVVDTVSVGDLPWEAYFETAELRELITSAIQHNNDLAVAIKNIDIANQNFKQARLGNVPSLSLQAGASLSRPSDNSLNGLTLTQFLNTNHIEDYTVSALLTWEADLWGKIKSQKASALAAYLQTREARSLLQTQVVSDIAKGYYNLLLLDEQLAIARRNVTLNDSTLQILELQFSSGQVTSLAVQQSRAEKLNAAGLIPQFEQQIALQEDAIAVLSGRLPAEIHRIVNLDDIRSANYLPTGIPSAMLNRRPDVRLSELALSQANADVGFAQGNMYPSLSISAQGGLDAIKASNWFSIPASLFGVVTGGLTQPLFDHRKLATKLEVAKINREKTVIQFRQTVITAAGEVSDQLVKLEKLRQQQAIAQQRVITLQFATQNARSLFTNGLANYLEVITAQSNVLQSELELASLKKARLDASVDLYRAVGGGWK